MYCEKCGKPVSRLHSGYCKRCWQKWLYEQEKECKVMAHENLRHHEFSQFSLFRNTAEQLQTARILL